MYFENVWLEFGLSWFNIFCWLKLCGILIMNNIIEYDKILLIYFSKYKSNFTCSIKTNVFETFLLVAQKNTIHLEIKHIPNP